MCMMSFIELQKISELSFECMFGLLYNRLFVVQNGSQAKNWFVVSGSQ